MAVVKCSGQLWVLVGLSFVFAVAFAQNTIPSKAMPLPDKCRVSELVPCGDAVSSRTDCEALNCCFDGERCYYGRKVTVQCTRDGQFVVVVAKDSTVPQLDLSTIVFLGGNNAPCCPVAITDSYAIYKFPVTACGTVFQEKGNDVVYENVLTALYNQPVPLASKEYGLHRLSFQCKYHSLAVIAPPPPIIASGSLDVELRLANGQCSVLGCDEGAQAYTSYYKASDYPVTKVLHQPVYVEVHILKRTDPDLVLLLEHCWATSSPDPLSQPQWDLLVDGCPYQGDKYLTNLVPVVGSPELPFPFHYKRFVVRMFTFVDPKSQLLQEKVFFHCSTAVCLCSATDGCEQRCHNGMDTSAVWNSRTKVSFSSGELNLVAPEMPR